MSLTDCTVHDINAHPNKKFKNLNLTGDAVISIPFTEDVFKFLRIDFGLYGNKNQFATGDALR